MWNWEMQTITVKIYVGVVTKFRTVMNLKEYPALFKVEIYNLNQW